MNTKKLLLVFVLLWVSALSLSAQTLVSVNKIIKQDTLLTTIQKNSVSSKNVLASGQAVFASKSGYVRILLSDDYGYDLLVYESSPLVVVNGVDNFNSVAMETANISSHLALTKVRVEIKNAELRNLSVDISAINPSRTQQQIRTDRIALINSNLRSQNALWVAGETSVSQMSYEEKKSLFGGQVPDLQGYEYYIGGIFELHSDSLTSTQNITRVSSYVSSFDWRNRHGANKPSSPYYNSGGNGWLTSTKNQGSCGGCWAFSALGVVEAMTNLYFNRFINPDLSEQELVSCATGTCSGGWPYNAHAYIKTNGVVDEATFPYQATNGNCSDKGLNPNETIKIHSHIGLGVSGVPNSVDELKQQIIKSPISLGFTLWNTAGHALVGVGYKVLQAGDTILLKTLGGASQPTTIIIPNGDPRIGETAWLLKNSHGVTWGDLGYGYVICPFSSIYACSYVQPPIYSNNYTNANIICEDRDGDGYYFWGIGSKPAHCPACAPNDPDGDDSNPNLGPMDQYGNCASITPLVENITTSQTWSTNRTLCKNVTIQSGVTLTITSAATVFSSSHTITIKNGGKLILSGGTIDDGYVIAQSGSELTISNNGKILLGNYDNLDVQLGAEFNLNYGEILLK
jgi:C1A family cysteine protease